MKRKRGINRSLEDGLRLASLSRAHSPKWNPRQEPLLLANIRSNTNQSLGMYRISPANRKEHTEALARPRSTCI